MSESMSRPAISVAPQWVGRSTPSGPAVVEIVPPVVMTVRRAMMGSLRTWFAPIRPRGLGGPYRP
ncbi:Uncharacterised protein [Mycobacterium tuberculosis]|nr:Uncharacterised protein [Mycobacterium tuberculosis]